MNEGPSPEASSLNTHSRRPSGPDGQHGALLTVAIPTFERAAFLETCLTNLCPQVAEHSDEVELVVIDNASGDETPEVVRRYCARFPFLVSHRHTQNIGSDRNIARCFESAKGRFILIFADDDVLLPGTLSKVLPVLREKDPGVVFLRPYGYDADFLAERPHTFSRSPRIYLRHQEFIRKVHVYCTFISAIVINKRAVGDINLQRYIGTNLVQVYLFCRAAMRAKANVYFPEYLVAAKRNNSGGYNALKVFVGNLNDALETNATEGISKETRRALNRKLITRHLPHYLLVMRMSASVSFDPAEVHRFLARYYARYPSYWICLYPLIRLPLPIAELWGWTLMLASRLVAGEFGRVVSFVWGRLRAA